MGDPTRLQVAVRAYTFQDTDAGQDHWPLAEAVLRPPHLLVLDAETTTDPSQRLLFLSYRIFEVTWVSGVPETHCLEEGLAHPDDLSTDDPGGFEVLGEYVRTHAPDVDLSRQSNPNLRLVSRTGFIKDIWRPLVLEAKAQVACFNMPFDLSRLAESWSIAGPARRRGERKRKPPRRSPYEGGFSFSMLGRAQDGTWKNNPYSPRVLIKHLDSKRALKGLGSTAGGDEDSFSGHLLDLRTLCFALTDVGFSLEGACKEFAVPYRKRKVAHGQITPEYIDYNREDVEATARLWQAATAEYVRHPIKVQATRAFSPASVGKGYLRAMNVSPARERLGESPEPWDQVLGYAMSAYYGGRADARIRRCAVPVTLVDFTSMYPTVQTLMGMERFLSCALIDAADEHPSRLGNWIRRSAPGGFFEPSAWQNLVALCLVEPAPGDVLPIRARYGGKGAPLGIGVSRWASAPKTPLWHTAPDVVASYLATGHLPKITRVIRFWPRGRARGLRATELRGEVSARLGGSFFSGIVTERAKLPEDLRTHGLGKALKVIANATSYGIFAEMIRHELSASRTENLHVRALSSFDVSTKTPEVPGEFFFSPAAALVTGAARLMLALLEHEVNALGGTYAFADTDSMAVVASPEHCKLAIGGIGTRGEQVPQEITALSWAEVDEVIGRFDRLSPYEDTFVPHLIKIEAENFDGDRRREVFAHVISAKRYCLYERSDGGSPVLVSISDSDDVPGEDLGEGVVKRSEHGLGHLCNPYDPDEDDRDWIEEAWHWLVQTDLGSAEPEPAWFTLPAVSQISASTPGGMKAFEAFNEGKSYAEQIKPFNFLLCCFPEAQSRPTGAPFRLVAPYEKDAAKWVSAEWFEVHTGERVKIATVGTGGTGLVRVKTYGDLIKAYRVHPERKSLGPDGKQCGRQTRGILGRFEVGMTGRPLVVGKESNRLEDRIREQVQGERDYLNIYEPRTCACGCAKVVTGRRRYVDQAHKQRAYRGRGGLEFEVNMKHWRGITHAIVPDPPEGPSDTELARAIVSARTEIDGAGGKVVAGGREIYVHVSVEAEDEVVAKTKVLNRAWDAFKDAGLSWTLIPFEPPDMRIDPPEPT